MTLCWCCFWLANEISIISKTLPPIFPKQLPRICRIQFSFSQAIAQYAQPSEAPTFDIQQLAFEPAVDGSRGPGGSMIAGMLSGDRYHFNQHSQQLGTFHCAQLQTIKSGIDQLTIVKLNMAKHVVLTCSNLDQRWFNP